MLETFLKFVKKSMSKSTHLLNLNCSYAKQKHVNEEKVKTKFK